MTFLWIYPSHGLKKPSPYLVLSSQNIITTKILVSFNSSDVSLGGFTIPAGAQVVPLLHAVHMDPELWDEPSQFRPQRFLNAEGKVCKPEYFMPFGVGRRMCLGDALARMELFLFFANVLHNFDLRLPEGDVLPSLRGNAGITVTPDPFKICAIRRDLEDRRQRNVGSS